MRKFMIAGATLAIGTIATPNLPSGSDHSVLTVRSARAEPQKNAGEPPRDKEWDNAAALDKKQRDARKGKKDDSSSSGKGSGAAADKR